MNIIILTQDENLYLPASFSQVCCAFPGEIVCIVSAPVMSTHGGAIRGFIKHFRLFGWRGTVIMGLRVAHAKINALITHPNDGGPFFSIAQVAMAFGIPLVHVRKLSDLKFMDVLDQYTPDLLISISCPQIIGRKIRERIPLGCINVHGAPLPKYRGLMPAFWVLHNSETKTATTVHYLAAKLDDGDIILQREVDILPDDTWDLLVRRTKAAGTQAIVEAIHLIKSGKVVRYPNPESESTYFSFPTAKDRKAFLVKGRRFF